MGRVYWEYALLTQITIPKQKNDFWPQISKFPGQNCTFSSLAANWRLTGQCFQHTTGVSGNSRSRSFPRMAVSDSLPEFREWIFFMCFSKLSFLYFIFCIGHNLIHFRGGRVGP